MIDSVRGFTDYFEGVRRRTIGFFRAVPPDRVEWSLGYMGGLEGPPM